MSDAQFNALFTAMTSHRDRAILAFYISTGVRASELLGWLRLYQQQLGGVVTSGGPVWQTLRGAPRALT